MINDMRKDIPLRECGILEVGDCLPECDVEVLVQLLVHCGALRVLLVSSHVVRVDFALRINAGFVE
jgi:hypothetical protein